MEKEVKELVLQKISEVEKYLHFIKEIGAIEKDTFIHDLRAIFASERVLQISIECVLDIGNILISQLALPKPSFYRDIATILSDANIITESLKERLIKIIALRNVLVHQYSKIQEEAIYEFIHLIDKDVEDFIIEIVSFLENH